MIYFAQPVVTFSDGKWRKTIQVASFYLNSDLQGIENESHAARIVENICNPAQDKRIRVAANVHPLNNITFGEIDETRLDAFDLAEVETELDLEPVEPEDGDYVTSDFIHFRQYDTIALTVGVGDDWRRELNNKMTEDGVYPNLWFSANGANFELIQPGENYANG